MSEAISNPYQNYIRYIIDIIFAYYLRLISSISKAYLKNTSSISYTILILLYRCTEVQSSYLFIFLIPEKKLKYLRLIFGVTFLTFGFPSPKQFCDFQYGCLVEYTIWFTSSSYSLKVKIFLHYTRLGYCNLNHFLHFSHYSV